jgi:acyl dehydratase
VRYTDASGDFNPLQIDPDIGETIGLTTSALMVRAAQPLLSLSLIRVSEKEIN